MGMSELDLRQFQVKRVDLVGAHITHQERRIVGSEATPSPAIFTVPVHILQINEEFRAGLPYFYTEEGRVFRGSIVVIDVPSIPRPGRKTNGAWFVDPVCPFLSLEVVEQKFLESAERAARCWPSG